MSYTFSKVLIILQKQTVCQAYRTAHISMADVIF